MKLPLKRLLLKLSGESMTAPGSFGIEEASCLKVAKTIKAAKDAGFEIAVVIGGGNIFRGASLQKIGIEEAEADHIGMLGTLMNGIALQGALNRLHCPAKVMSALECPKLVVSYNRQGALDFLRKGIIPIFVGGTGHPYFTTDTAAALRACEMGADLLIKATQVDGVYDKDPLSHPEAKRYKELNHSQALAEKLEVMDATSIALCRSHKVPIFVCSLKNLYERPLEEALTQLDGGTLIKGDV